MRLAGKRFTDGTNWFEFVNEPSAGLPVLDSGSADFAADKSALTNGQFVVLDGQFKKFDLAADNFIDLTLVDFTTAAAELPHKQIR